METFAETPRHDQQLAQQVDHLVSKLDHYRQQSETLQKVNTLHQRLSGLLDLPTMIETTSIWLMEHVHHDLIGFYSDEHQKMHMYCSDHGPVRKKAIQVAENSLKKTPPTQHSPKDIVFQCDSCLKNNDGNYVLYRNKLPFSENEIAFIRQTCAIIDAPVQRALEFEQVFAQAHKDPLTNLPNRNVFNERIPSLIDQANRYNHPLTLASLDLDNFKAVNDSMGHLYGDQVLQQVTAVLNEQIRLSDMLVRMGGDEFILVLPDTDIHSAKCITDRLCKAVDNLNIVTPKGTLGVSIGIAQWHEGLSLSKWLEIADDTLYKAKESGKGQVFHSIGSLH
ncbi:MAG: GGDEF domain-containing protein [Desulfobulbus propionicus]|nr:MAG: GGDEF domain-containing protein [Desulfobulbus propionicus]